jgi:hypothetical protein
MKIFATLAFILVTTASAQMQDTDLTGKWNGSLTRTAPDGRSQTIAWMLDLTHEGNTLTGTSGPSPERQWPLEKGATVEGSDVTFRVQQPQGPMRTFTLRLVDGRLTGQMLAELDGQSFTTEVTLARGKE